MTLDEFTKLYEITIKQNEAFSKLQRSQINQISTELLRLDNLFLLDSYSALQNMRVPNYAASRFNEQTSAEIFTSQISKFTNDKLVEFAMQQQEILTSLQEHVGKLSIIPDDLLSESVIRDITRPEVFHHYAYFLNAVPGLMMYKPNKRQRMQRKAFQFMQKAPALAKSTRDYLKVRNTFKNRGFIMALITNFRIMSQDASSTEYRQFCFYIFISLCIFLLIMLFIVPEKS